MAETKVGFWRCANERAEAQAVAREIESVLAQGEARVDGICVAIPPGGSRERTIAAALEERRVPYRLLAAGAFFQRPEVRDVIAWLRLLADPSDAAAAVRALSRPPVELRSVDLARCTTIARRRKLDMVSSALEASLESPQIPPEARDRIRSFLGLYGAAARAMGQLSADVFVRRLIERVGFRRQRLFAANPEAAERLRNLSRLGDLAATWVRREPGGSNRDFVRYLVAVSEAGVSPEEEPDAPHAGAVRVMPLGALKGMEFDQVFLVGMQAEAMPGPVPQGAPEVPMALGGGGPSPRPAAAPPALHGDDARPRPAGAVEAARRARTAPCAPSPFYEDARAVLDAKEQSHGEELFGPAEGLHATYRMIQDEVLEEAWRAGGQLNEPRLDTSIDVNRAVARFLELLKLAALIQRPGEEPVADSLRNVNEVLAQAITPRAAPGADGLGARRLPARRGGRERPAPRARRGARRALAGGLPAEARRGAGAVGDRHRALPDLPAEVQVRARLRHPPGADDQPALRHRHPPGAGALPLAGGQPPRRPAASNRLMALFSAAWRRSGFGESDDELQFRERAIEALRRYHARESARGSSPRWVERKFDFQIGPHHLRGRVDRVDELPDGGYELIDYKTGDPRPQQALEADIQLAIYRLAAREAWRLDGGSTGSYWYVLADEKVAVGGSPDDLERVEAHGAGGRRGDPRPGLRAPALAGDLLLVRLQADLPGVRGLGRRPRLEPAGSRDMQRPPDPA